MTDRTGSPTGDGNGDWAGGDAVATTHPSVVAPEDLPPVAPTDPSTVDVKHALRALADGTAPATPTHGQVIVRATTATDDVRELARFVASVGTGGLRQAIAAAEDRNDPVAARRGRRVLDAIERYRRAAAGDAEAADYIHCGRKTVLSGDSQRTDT